MSDDDRERFDALLEEALDALPSPLLELLEEAPLIVDDRPSPELLRSLGMTPNTILCGLHTGIALTDRSVEHSGVPGDVIHLFREGVLETAGGWNQKHADDLVYEEIMVTLLHEIGHHFGLDEDDLDELGYA